MARRRTEEGRTFTPEELAFFVIPRRWTPATGIDFLALDRQIEESESFEGPLPRGSTILTEVEQLRRLKVANGPCILARFGFDADVRDGLIYADSDGGRGWLDWVKPQKAWFLTERGRRYVGSTLVKRATVWYPTGDEVVRWNKAVADKIAKLARGIDDDAPDPDEEP
jgi:hypothetical protein